MKLKYYLRGLGMGIIATMLILGLRKDAATAMSDEAVIARAKELGMIENTRFLSELQAEDITPQTESTEETAAEDAEATDAEMSGTDMESTDSEEVVAGTDTAETGDTETSASDTLETEDNETETDESEDNKTESSESGVEDSEEPTESTNAEEVAEETETTEENDIQYSDAPVFLKIESGSSSYTVSKDLEEAGLIRDAAAFDQYLIDNGYSKSIRVGTYELLPGTNEKDIAKIITGK